MSRSSVITKPRKPSSPRRQSRITAGDSEAGTAARLEARIMRVADHHAVHLVSEGAEHGEFAGVEFGAGAVDARQFVVRIEPGESIAGKMFAAGKNPFGGHRRAEGLGIGDGFLDAAAVATAAQRIVGLIVEGNVEHRAQVEVEAEQAQQLAGQRAVAGDQAGSPR